MVVETFDIEGVKDKIESTVDNCMQKDDVTECLKGEVGAVSDALGKAVSKEARDKVDLLHDVYVTCNDVEGDKEIEKCAFKEGKRCLIICMFLSVNCSLMSLNSP